VIYVLEFFLINFFFWRAGVGTGMNGSGAGYGQGGLYASNDVVVVGAGGGG
jgi:hypothetical protein